jgi:hypothetical protein
VGINFKGTLLCLGLLQRKARQSREPRESTATKRPWLAGIAVTIVTSLRATWSGIRCPAREVVLSLKAPRPAFWYPHSIIFNGHRFVSFPGISSRDVNLTTLLQLESECKDKRAIDFPPYACMAYTGANLNSPPSLKLV